MADTASAERHADNLSVVIGAGPGRKPAGRGIHVNAVCPWPVETPMPRGVMDFGRPINGNMERAAR